MRLIRRRDAKEGRPRSCVGGELSKGGSLCRHLIPWPEPRRQTAYEEGRTALIRPMLHEERP